MNNNRIEFDQFVPKIQDLIKVVSKEMGIFDYWNVFQKNDRIYNDAKMVCYKILLDTGMNRSQIAHRFFREFSTIKRAIDKVEANPVFLEKCKIIEEYAKKSISIKFAEEVDFELVYRTVDLLNQEFNKREIMHLLVLQEWEYDNLMNYINGHFKKINVPEYHSGTVHEKYVDIKKKMIYF